MKRLVLVIVLCVGGFLVACSSGSDDSGSTSSGEIVPLVEAEVVSTDLEVVDADSSTDVGEIFTRDCAEMDMSGYDSAEDAAMSGACISAVSNNDTVSFKELVVESQSPGSTQIKVVGMREGCPVDCPREVQVTFYLTEVQTGVWIADELYKVFIEPERIAKFTEK